LRARRLLGGGDWPLKLSIGKPPSSLVLQQPAVVRQHIQSWRQVSSGKVEFAALKYRGLAGSIDVPLYWHLDNPSQWIAACRDADIRQEYALLEQLVADCTDDMRELLVRERSLWRGKPVAETLQTIDLAMTLEPGCAAGQPLRLMAGLGVDTKFFERNETLLRRLLDTRFSGAASEQGLATFLHALDEKDHWLLIRPLSAGLLPFSRLRLTDSELAQTELPASRVLLVENEQCEHLLPELEDCIAILGSGANLSWLAGSALRNKQLFYWGDLDTWGLTLLGRARELQPDVQAVLMGEEVFCDYAAFAVPEPQAATHCHNGLRPAEVNLYNQLLRAEKGRLEQEFIPAERVARELMLALGKQNPQKKRQ
jgi:hypothetical protein